MRCYDVLPLSRNKRDRGGNLLAICKSTSQHFVSSSFQILLPGISTVTFGGSTTYHQYFSCYHILSLYARFMGLGWWPSWRFERLPPSWILSAQGKRSSGPSRCILSAIRCTNCLMYPRCMRSSTKSLKSLHSSMVCSQSWWNSQKNSRARPTMRNFNGAGLFISGVSRTATST